MAESKAQKIADSLATLPTAKKVMEQIALEQDEAKRQTLLNLLSEEQAKLAAFDVLRQRRRTFVSMAAAIHAMRGPHVDAFFSFGIDPTAEDAAA